MYLVLACSNDGGIAIGFLPTLAMWAIELLDNILALNPMGSATTFHTSLIGSCPRKPV